MVIKIKWVCPNGCSPGHAAEVPCPTVMAAAEHARRYWKVPRAGLQPPKDVHEPERSPG